MSKVDNYAWIDAMFERMRPPPMPSFEKVQKLRKRLEREGKTLYVTGCGTNCVCIEEVSVEEGERREELRRKE